MPYTDEEENTRTQGLKRPSVRMLSVPPSAPASADLHELVGQLLAQTARLTSQVTDLAPLANEVAQLRRDIELDRKALVHGTATKAANHSSNRMAVLMGTLFSLYEVSSPYLHDLWRMFHK